MTEGPGLVTDSWARIDAWLGTHAHSDLADLRPRVTDDDLAALESTLGSRLPAELAASLSRHDGQQGHVRTIFPAMRLLPAQDILESWRTRMEVAEEFGGFEARPWENQPWWHPQWIPWGDANGDLHIIDMRPGPRSRQLGVAVHDGCGDFGEDWPSLAHYLRAVADALHHGGSVSRWHPYLTVENNLWWGFEGETELNGQPLRPAPIGLDA